MLAARRLVGAGDFPNTHVQGHGEGEVLPTDCRAEGATIPPDRRVETIYCT